MPDPSDRLESWKEIAAYLGREVRTVQLWEKGEDLPIHRQQHSKQGSVYAFKSELDVWREARKSEPSSRAKSYRLMALASLVILAVCAAGFVWWKRGRAAQEPLSSVAVLPFLDLSPQKDQEYFSDG